jgi:hypothetical protein
MSMKSPPPVPVMVFAPAVPHSWSPSLSTPVIVTVTVALVPLTRR